nr:inositol oxygenase 1 [Quercus suber]
MTILIEQPEFGVEGLKLRKRRSLLMKKNWCWMVDLLFHRSIHLATPLETMMLKVRDGRAWITSTIPITFTRLMTLLRRRENVVDESDPDLDYPDEDWLHLTGLIHDLGKVLLLPSFGELPQWAVVGDTFPVGCAYDESVVHHKYFKENADYYNPAYNTKYGVYSEGCGLNNVMMSWGHDDYMYLVAKENKTTLPSAGLFIIRYHSFYALHRSGAYKHLMNEEDVENLKWLQIFNKYDLYSKSKVRIDVEKVKPYYISLIEKYFPAKLKW